MRSGPSQIVRDAKIATATTGEYAMAAVLWLILAGLIAAAWTLLFEACWVTVPVRWGANFCPRLEQGGLFTEEQRNRELATRLATVKSDLTNRAPCPTPQP